MASELDYVPMPDAVVNLIQSSWKQIKDGAGREAMHVARVLAQSLTVM